MSRRVETAFLPAALEIQEAPPSPAGRAILWTILSFFVLTLAWAALSEVDIVAVAQGRIIPSGHSKTVQPLEIGTVRSIHVKEGQQVQAGDVLIELDTTAAGADVERLHKERSAAAREIARYEQITDWLDREHLPTVQVLNANRDRVLVQQWQEYQDRLTVLRHEQDMKRAEKRSAQRQVDKLEAVLPIVSRRAKNQKRLADKKMLAEQQYLETEQERLETLHDLRTYEGRVEELQVAILELDARRTFARSEYHRQALEQLEDAERRHSGTEQELIKAESRASAQIITAPVDGAVQQITVHNIGAVVTPAQSLMVIVPKDNTLEVEATLENKDIGFVEVGQPTEVKVDTFPFTKYGTIKGEIIDLSNDAVADEHKGLVYKMRVAMARDTVEVNGKPVELHPGMTVTVESKTGTRKMIEFFFSPLLRYANESARER